MSAGTGKQTPKVNRDLSVLAPKFREAVDAAIADCAHRGLDAMVYEGYRSLELQVLYYARGRTIIPPKHTVTNAPTNLYSWHGYGLAVDVVHRIDFWEPEGGEAWFRKVSESFKKFGCSWGGDWNRPDTPHFQWGRCKPSPSEEARKLLTTRGILAVWQVLGAH